MQINQRGIEVKYQSLVQGDRHQAAIVCFFWSHSFILVSVWMFAHMTMPSQNSGQELFCRLCWLAVRWCIDKQVKIEQSLTERLLWMLSLVSNLSCSASDPHTQCSSADLYIPNYTQQPHDAVHWNSPYLETINSHPEKIGTSELDHLFTEQVWKLWENILSEQTSTDPSIEFGKVVQGATKIVWCKDVNWGYLLMQHCSNNFRPNQKYEGQEMINSSNLGTCTVYVWHSVGAFCMHIIQNTICQDPRPFLAYYPASFSFFGLFFFFIPHCVGINAESKHPIVLILKPINKLFSVSSFLHTLCHKWG